MNSTPTELKFESDRIVNDAGEVLINMTGRPLILISEDKKTMHCLKSSCIPQYCRYFGTVNNSFGVRIDKVGMEKLEKIPKYEDGIFYIVDNETLHLILSARRNADNFFTPSKEDFNKEAGVYVYSKLKKVEYKYDFER